MSHDLTLRSYDDAASIREATLTELAISLEAGDTGTFAIDADGNIVSPGDMGYEAATTVYVDGDVDDDCIDELREEACAAGDAEQEALCERALAGDRAARAACVRAMAEAEAQEEVAS